MLCFPKEGLRGICPFFFFHKYAYICKWIRRNLKETVLVKNKRSPPSCHGGGGGVLLLTLTFWRVNCGRGIHAEQHVKGIANLYFIQLKAIKSACEVTRGRHAK